MHGSRKTQRNCRLASTTKPNWSMTILRVHWILSILCAELLKNSMPTTRPHKKGLSLALGTIPTRCLWRIKNKNVLQPSTNSTGFWKEVLPLNRCIGLRRGHCTLAAGNEPTLRPQTLKTKKSSDCILLSNVHSHRMKLQHLWKRTVSNNEVVSALMTIPGMDERTIYHPYWPCQPSILESASKPQSKNSKMACGPTRIQLRNSTRSWENERNHRHTIMTTKRRSRRKR
jgi:hypothetical protein